MARGNESCSTARAPTLGAVSPGLSGADQFPVRLGEATVTDILTNDEISLLRSLEKKSRTITGNFTNKRYDRLETEGYIKRSSQSPSMPNMLYEITDAGKAALRAAGGAATDGIADAQNLGTPSDFYFLRGKKLMANSEKCRFYR
jgi:hypothetical protein